MSFVLEDVLFAINDVDEAVFVDVAYVTGFEETIGVDCIGGCFWVVVITLNLG